MIHSLALGLNIRDAVLVILYHFGRLEAPPHLFDGCNTDATEDGLPECQYKEGLCEDARVGLRRGDRNERYWKRAAKKRQRMLRKFRGR